MCFFLFLALRLDGKNTPGCWQLEIPLDALNMKILNWRKGFYTISSCIVPNRN